MSEEFVTETRMHCAAKQGGCSIVEQTLGGMVDLGWLDMVASSEGLAYVPTQRAVEFFGLDEMGIRVSDEGAWEFVD